MDNNVSDQVACIKKHKKHRRDRDDKPGLKLILKVGSNNTPEHEEEYVQNLTEDSSSFSLVPNDSAYPLYHGHHKKSKKKKKKKEKDRERRHKHHHKDKKRKRGDVEDENIEEMDTLLGVYPLLGSPNSQREQRSCVIKKIQERSSLSKALDHLLNQLEKKDSHNFFAWPVTDNIAPGYSRIISKPMDFSTMRQKVEENQYKRIKEFIEDFSLMCENAMKYNHVDTVYFKASKKLLQAGLKVFQQDKLVHLLQIAPDLTEEEIGFEITPEMRSAVGVKSGDEAEGITKIGSKEPLTPEEILAQANNAARLAKAKLKGQGPSIGYLRTRRDGSAQLAILVGNNAGKRKLLAPLGSLVGRLSDGSAHLQGFREDRRNTARPVKSLYYGAFGSYAPSHDSAFANLTKEESALVLRTYGSDTAVQYAESIQDFVKGCDYGEQLVDSLLDLLSGGDHSKTKSTIEEGKRLKDEENAVRTILETTTDTLKVNVDELKSLQEIGIDVNFLDAMEDEIKQSEERHEMQQKLNDMCQLLEKLQKTQYERLSQSLPSSLHNIARPTQDESNLADQCVENLTEISKKVLPGAIAPVSAIRKALGVTVPPSIPDPEPDLETELRQFLEEAQQPTHLETDNAIEEILME
ncbi:bromodomain-containing protein 7 [Sitophilus oryzae]|uniref:Bromodomain-containing protein 7 n=1 Tax=Sitophilus oryzae TaxID=7048 RepID=A0A6J2XRV7_SITOR|nr:bromodomain-containing protein 7 [Sitophilus oryzae]